MLLQFAHGPQGKEVIKNPDDIPYLDPLSCFDDFMIEVGEANEIIHSQRKPLYASPHPGFSRIVNIPSSKLRAANAVNFPRFIHQVIMDHTDKSHSMAAFGLFSVIPFVDRYCQTVDSGSYHPEIIDLFNIWKGLCNHKPDLVIEIGGGVSTSLISYYCSNHNTKHILIDPEEFWVKNTFKGLSACGLTPPLFEPLQVIQKQMTNSFGTNKAKYDPKCDLYLDFDYEKSWFLDLISNSEKKLVFIDANVEDSFFQGAELFIDPVVAPLLTKSLVLVDWRVKACQLLSSLNGFSELYSTNTSLLFDGIPSDGNLINYGFSAFVN